MEEKRFCPYCGTKVSVGAKFCGGCGKSLVSEVEPTIIPKEEIEKSDNLEESKQEIKKAIEKDSLQDSADTKISSSNDEKKEEKTSAKPDEKIEKTKQQATEMAKSVENKIKVMGENVKKQGQQLKQQYDSKDDKSKNTIQKILLVVVIALVSGGGIWWYQGKDYRQAMKAGETYFERGEYGESQKYFKEAHDEKPGNKEALTMLDHSEYLGNIWTNINQGWGDQVIVYACDEIESKISEIKDKKVKEKYQEALTRIENSSDYKLEKRIREKLGAAYK